MSIRLEAGNGCSPESASTLRPWVIPYIDQPLAFWEGLAQEWAGRIGEVYFPLARAIIGSGRPTQSDSCLDDLLKHSPFPLSVVLNPIVLPCPVDESFPPVLEALKRLIGEHGLKGATVSNLQLATRIHEALPSLHLTASVLMDIERPHQVQMLAAICDGLVPSGRVLRDWTALTTLRAAFTGRFRLIVNESCIPGCLLRVQHFYEMSSGHAYPRSLCEELLARDPWLRLTGTWILPQHVAPYAVFCDELKLAGRVTLRDPERYRAVLRAYMRAEPMLPHEIGGGPASVLTPVPIDDEFVRITRQCGLRCHQCSYCREYYARYVS